LNVVPVNYALPIKQTLSPADPQELAAAVADAHARETPLYPIGGGTSLDFGLPAKENGVGLSLEKLNRVIDYPARDLTVTVEAGLTMRALADLLAKERQRLPIDVPQADKATIGGVVATNFNGPRRFGQGTVRDHVIGISAVDGRGSPFKGGGRVVKNVAGYDFCKLLCGSMGTLAVITQVTLKVRPRPSASAIVTYDATDLDRVEALLAALTTTRTTPVAVELTVPNGSPRELLFGFEGTHVEVEWLVAQLEREFLPLGAKPKQVVRDSETADVWQRLTMFGCAPESSSLVLKLNVRPSRVVELCKTVGTLVPNASIQAHAGSGIILVDCGDLPSHEAAKLLIRDLRPAAAAAGGQAVVWNCPSPDEWTRQAFWGPTRDDDAVMRAVKRQFEPHGLLNPGRFIF
jgi:glycolate oxidase FAD binding subunit